MKINYEEDGIQISERELDLKPCPVCGKDDCLHLTIRNKSDGFGMGETFWMEGTLKCDYCGCMTISNNGSSGGCIEEMKSNWNSMYYKKDYKKSDEIFTAWKEFTRELKTDEDAEDILKQILESHSEFYPADEINYINVVREGNRDELGDVFVQCNNTLYYIFNYGSTCCAIHNPHKKEDTPRSIYEKLKAAIPLPDIKAGLHIIYSNVQIPFPLYETLYNYAEKNKKY